MRGGREWKEDKIGSAVLRLHPLNIPDRKCFGYGQLWPLRPACSQNGARSYMPDPSFHIWFGSVFPKKAWTILCKTNLNPIWIAWSGFGQMHLVCTKLTEPGFWQNATSPLPVSHFQTRLRFSTDGPDYVVQNQAGSDLVLADCVRFGPNRSSVKASQCARIIWPTSGQCSWANLNWMWIGSGMFTVQSVWCQSLHPNKCSGMQVTEEGYLGVKLGHQTQNPLDPHKWRHSMYTDLGRPFVVR